MAKARVRSVSVPPLMHSRKLFKLMGTTGLVISSGYFAYQTYSLKQAAQIQEKLVHFSGLPPKIYPVSEFLDIPEHKTGMLPMDSLEAKIEIKSMIPKHLRKSWKLLHQANMVRDHLSFEPMFVEYTYFTLNYKNVF